VILREQNPDLEDCGPRGEREKSQPDIEERANGKLRSPFQRSWNVDGLPHTTHHIRNEVNLIHSQTRYVIGYPVIDTVHSA
jgi:hypothetical protein